jgi:glycosyltransferase involved in cell wall biosynthesis
VPSHFRDARDRGLAPKVLVVSHPAALAVNQLPYQELVHRGWDVRLVVPATWRHDYAPQAFAAERLEGLGDRVQPLPVLNAGSVQRHAYVAFPSRIIRAFRPDVGFVEAEPTSLPAFQWGWALSRARVTFGLQADENLDRPYHPVARAFRRWAITHAAFVAARSPTAARLLCAHGAKIPTPVVPHPVPRWDAVRHDGDRPFTVGFGGRLVPEKGVRELVSAMHGLPGAHMRFVGNGPLADELRGATISGGSVEVITDIPHSRMAEAYASFDVLVLPSLTTETWAEQFGRVLVEALWCGVPVIGSSSGEIPWVVGATEGGIVVPEGDVAALRAALIRLRDDPELRRRLGGRGRTLVERTFSMEASTDALEAALQAAMAARAS